MIPLFKSMFCSFSCSNQHLHLYLFNKQVYPCTGITFVYEVILTNTTGSIINKIMMEDCSGEKCHVTLEVSRTEYGMYFVEVTAIINGQQNVRGVPYMSDAISKWHINSVLK